ncbi:hypothetical protein L7F22_017054 [Adiantum nelumboides]|nr:hypothetical protein [Adiantum nelumboides]
MASDSESGNLLHIKKLEGAHNYAIWKKQCYNVMLQKKQAKPIKTEGEKPANMTDEDWEEVDELACSTIMLSVSDSLLFNVENEDTAWGMWKRLEDLYAQQSAASKGYWLKKLMDLRMKEGVIEGDYNVFKRGVSSEEKFDHKDKGRSKSCSKRDVECHHCGKKGHYKRGCYAWKKEKNKGADTDAKDKGNAKKSIVLIEEINVASSCDSDSNNDRYIASETLQVFAPLAKLLGMYRIKSELEDLSFLYSHPDAYAELKQRVEEVYNEHEEEALEAKRFLLERIADDQFLSFMAVDVKAYTLCKELYSGDPASQTGFVQDRSILDNVVIFYEAVEWACQTEQHTAIMLLDFEKAYDIVDWGFLEGTLSRMQNREAYDIVDWGFLEGTLSKMGFSDAWIQGISALY